EMIASLLLYAVGFPIVTGLLIFFVVVVWDNVPGGILPVPILATAGCYLGLLGIPVSPFASAVSLFFYVSFALLILPVVESVLPDQGLLVSLYKILCLLGLWAVIYYPRGRVSTDIPTEVTISLLILAGVFFLWELLESPVEGLRVSIAGPGLHLVAGGVLFGVYTSFIAGQLALAGGAGILSFFLATLLMSRSIPARDHSDKLILFPLLLTLYGLFYTTLSWTTLCIYLVALLALLLPKFISFDERALMSTVVICSLILIMTGAAAFNEEYNPLVETTEEGESYRPYDR
ncbi:MAG: hypothetical protein ABEK50_18980, partial [bacterium]